MDDGKLRIAELARRAGVPTPTLRYYEEVGLLRPAAVGSGQVAAAVSRQ